MEPKIMKADIQTHWDGCWKEHHQCAIEKIEQDMMDSEAARIGGLKYDVGQVLMVKCTINSLDADEEVYPYLLDLPDGDTVAMGQAVVENPAFCTPVAKE